MSSLHTKYRPKDLSEVLGQDQAVKALERVLTADRARAYLFHGPSGAGKTTLARIVANRIGVVGDDLIEVDAATRSGVSDTRSIADTARFRGIGKSGKKAIIVDEAHQLSKQAWDSLLKPLEEPSSYVTWLLCTTELNKVPRTIQTRCACFALKDVEKPKLALLVKRVAKKEGIKLREGVSDIIAECAGGSPRQALVLLELAGDASTKEEIYALLDQADPETAEAIDLCRALAKGASWTTLVECVRKLEKVRPESVRRVVLSYFTSAALRASSASKAERSLAILDAFSQPYPNEPGLHPLLLSIEQVVE